MGSAEEALASKRESAQDNDELPSYAEASAASFAEAESSTSASAAGPSHPSQLPAGQAGPTVTSPFDFPSQEECPPYTEYHSVQKPIAIPQAQADAASPFLQAYAPTLLSYGIPSSSWHSFLATMSAFLAATVSDRALSHAADIGRDLGEVPRSFGRGVAQHARAIGREIGDSAKRGDVAGVVRGALGGSVALPVAAALGIVGAAVQLPGSAAAAVARRPQAPRERAQAYLAAANRDWFRPRGLEGRLLDTAQLAAEAAGGAVSAQQVVDAAARAESAGAEKQLAAALGGRISELQVDSSATLAIGAKSLWLVLVQKEVGR